MDKISKIVPGKPRVSTVDVKNSAAVRPGTVAFGRPVGVSTGGVPDSMTTAQKAMEQVTQQEDKRAREQRNAQLVQQTADQFFLSKGRSLEKPTEMRATGEMSPVVSSEMEVVKSADEIGEDLIAVAPERYTPRGTYIDVRA